MQLKIGGRQIPELGIGLAIIGASVLGMLWYDSASAEGQQVLVVSHQLQRGELVDAADINSITISTSQDIALIDGSHASELIGLRVTSDLKAGTPFSEAVLSQVPPPRDGDGFIGLSIPAGHAPADLGAGDDVAILTVTHESDGSMTRGRIPGEFEIWSVSPFDEMTGDREVSVRIPVQRAIDVVGFDEVHLVKVGG